MDPGKSPLETALSDLARSRERELETHPAAGELAAYLDGELPPADQERLRDHLALCQPCARLVRDLAAEADLEVPDEVERRLDHDVEGGWETLKSRLGGRAGNDRQERVRESFPLFQRKPFLPFAFAALMVAVLGLAFWGSASEQEVDGVAGENRERIDSSGFEYGQGHGPRPTSRSASMTRQ